MGRPKGSKNKPKETTVEVIPDTTVAPDVPEEGKLGRPHHQDRASVINEIAASNREEDDTYESAEEVELEEETDDQEAEEETEEEVQASEESEEEPVKEPEPERKKFVVDGKEVEFTDEQIRAIVQKSTAADQRLAEATRLLEDAKRNAATPEPAPSKPAQPSSEPMDEGKVQEVTQALLYGDEEQVAKAVSEILGGRRGQQVATETQGMNPDQVRNYVIETIAFEDGKRLLETPADKGGYADIWGDPVLKLRFQQREAELRDVQKDERPYKELYKAIGDELREWRDNLVKQYIPKSGLEDRQDAKRKTGIVRGAGGRQAPQQTEAKPLSFEEKLAQTRRARGLN